MCCLWGIFQLWWALKLTIQNKTVVIIVKGSYILKTIEIALLRFDASIVWHVWEIWGVKNVWLKIDPRNYECVMAVECRANNYQIVEFFMT